MNSVSKEKLSHRVFPLTYLRKVNFSISFDMLTKECYSTIVEFISSNFGFEVTEERLENISNRPLYFGTVDHAVEWKIKDSSLSIRMAQEAYVSFDTSLLPLIEITQGFLRAAKRNAIEISLNKINLIPVTLSTSKEMADNVSHVFTEQILNKWNEDIYQKDEDSLVYLIREKGSKGEDVEILSGFIAKRGEQNQPSRYILDITASLIEEISSENLVEKVNLINHQLFDIFIRSVEEEIIKSMEGA